MIDLHLLSGKALDEFFGQIERFTYKIDISNLHYSYLETLRGIIENDGMRIIDETKDYIEVDLVV